jgi:hypothetical protein
MPSPSIDFMLSLMSSLTLGSTQLLFRILKAAPTIASFLTAQAELSHLGFYGFVHPDLSFKTFATRTCRTEASHLSPERTAASSFGASTMTSWPQALRPWQPWPVGDDFAMARAPSNQVLGASLDDMAGRCGSGSDPAAPAQVDSRRQSI